MPRRFLHLHPERPLVRASRSFLTALVTLTLLHGPVAAQRPDSLTVPPRDSLAADTSAGPTRPHAAAGPHVVRWYEATAALGGVGALMLLDEPVQRYSQRHRSRTADDIAGVFRQEGEVPYYAGITVGLIGLGVVAGDPGIQRAGIRAGTAVLLSAGEMLLIKHLVGRSRPNENVGAFAFHPFTSVHDSAGIETRGAMPSGHVTAAFAMATSLADDIDTPLAKVLLYTAATGTAFSRINDNRHWLSDTGMGAVLGVLTAKVVNGHWRIFKLRPPAFLVSRGGASVTWNVRF
jgi:membrane-associated phospholipid phosphatase